MGFMVFKSTGLDSQFQRKNLFWKICMECQNITKKVSKIGLPNQTSKIWHILAHISGLGAYFSKPIFALKLWVQAGRFEYHEPYNLNNFFFTYKGVRATFGVASGNSSRPPRELKFFLVSPMTYSNGKMQRANSNSKILFFWTPLPLALVFQDSFIHQILSSFCASIP